MAHDEYVAVAMGNAGEPEVRVSVTREQKRAHRHAVSQVHASAPRAPGNGEGSSAQSPRSASATIARVVTPEEAASALLVELAQAKSVREAQRLALRLRAEHPEAERIEPLVAALLARARELDQLRRLAGRDELTGIANRRTFNDTLRRELARSRRDATCR